MPRLCASSTVPNSRRPCLRQISFLDLFALLLTTRVLLGHQTACILYRKCIAFLEPCMFGLPALCKGLIGRLSRTELCPQEGYFVDNCLHIFLDCLAAIACLVRSGRH